jgi:hypothetical protein
VAASGGPTYLTWATLATKHETYNSAQGIRKKTAEGDSWGDSSNNVSLSNETIGVGERVVWEINSAVTLNLMVGLHNSLLDIRNAAGCKFGIEVGAYVGAYGREDAGNVGSAVAFGTLVDGTLLSIFYENASTIKYQYSLDGGGSWTTFHTSANTPSGTYNVQIQPYGELTGTDQIYKD